jgi:AcrR family transcriptional regulator
MSVRTPGQPTPPARARQAQARDRARRDILLAAASVFARKGYEATTLADLALATGYAAPSLYRYFEGKEAIFRSLLQLVKGELMATFDLPVDGAAPLRVRLTALLRAQAQLSRDRREVFDLLLRERPNVAGDPSGSAGLHAGLLLYQERMTAWLKAHTSRRELSCPVEDVARAVTGISHAFHDCHLASDEQLDPDDQARRVVALLLDGVQARPTSH